MPVGRAINRHMFDAARLADGYHGFQSRVGRTKTPGYHSAAAQACYTHASGVDIIAAKDLTDAANKVVAATK